MTRRIGRCTTRQPTHRYTTTRPCGVRYTRLEPGKRTRCCGCRCHAAPTRARLALLPRCAPRPTLVVLPEMVWVSAQGPTHVRVTEVEARHSATVGLFNDHRPRGHRKQRLAGGGIGVVLYACIQLRADVLTEGQGPLWGIIARALGAPAIRDAGRGGGGSAHAAHSTPSSGSRSARAGGRQVSSSGVFVGEVVEELNLRLREENLYR